MADGSTLCTSPHVTFVCTQTTMGLCRVQSSAGRVLSALKNGQYKVPDSALGYPRNTQGKNKHGFALVHSLISRLFRLFETSRKLVQAFLIIIGTPNVQSLRRMYLLCWSFIRSHVIPQRILICFALLIIIRSWSTSLCY